MRAGGRFQAAQIANVPFFAIEVLASKADCIKLILKNGNPYSQPGLTKVFSNTVDRTLPITLAAATSAACTKNTNIVDFVYRLAR